MAQKPMSELEQEVMTIIWGCKSCSVRDIMEKLKGKKFAYTTIATILQRLYEKGIVMRVSEGISFIYSPKVTKEEYTKRLVQSFMKKFFSSFGEVAVVSFAQSIDKLSKDKKDYLLKMLDKQNENK